MESSPQAIGDHDPFEVLCVRPDPRLDVLVAATTSPGAIEAPAEALRRLCPPQKPCATFMMSRSSGRTNVHTTYTCDGCGVKPIVGTRYHCAHCPNFDLCESCEARLDKDPSFHNPRHFFVKWKKTEVKGQVFVKDD